MSVSARIISALRVTETVEDGIPYSSDPIVKHNLSKEVTLPSGTTVPADTMINSTLQLSATALSVDLDALVAVGGATVSLAGKRVQCLYIENPTTNSQPITVSVPTEDGYALGNNTSYLDSIPVGGSSLKYFPDTNPNVVTDGTAQAHLITLGSADTDATVKFGLLAG